jgi:hypothetical protein
LSAATFAALAVAARQAASRAGTRRRVRKFRRMLDELKRRLREMCESLSRFQETSLGKQSNVTKPNPLVVVALAFVTGVAVAKWIDWRGHAHPRR